ncbi:transcriptional repressor [Planctomycetota bacterium]|nr:transcriptional repressor [Planctomycetota bacterium]
MSEVKANIPKRNTVQRKTVEHVINDAEGPLTVQEIHEHANAKCDVGIATVYRIVKALHEGGDIKCVVLPDGQNRYEAAHLGHHHHFRCRVCQRVFDLHICPVSLPEGTTLPGGFLVDGHELTLFGTCPDCAAKADEVDPVEAMNVIETDSNNE